VRKAQGSRSPIARFRLTSQGVIHHRGVAIAFAVVVWLTFCRMVPVCPGRNRRKRDEHGVLNFVSVLISLFLAPWVWATPTGSPRGRKRGRGGGAEMAIRHSQRRGAGAGASDRPVALD